MTHTTLAKLKLRIERNGNMPRLKELHDFLNEQKIENEFDSTFGKLEIPEAHMVIRSGDTKSNWSQAFHLVNFLDTKGIA